MNESSGIDTVVMATGKGPIGSFELISAQRGMSVKVVFHFIVCNLVVRLAVFVFVEETRLGASRAACLAAPL